MELSGAEILGLVSDDGARVSRRLFFDEAIYRRELERVFGRCWLFLGHESQVPQAGDFFLSRMGEESVIVSRRPDGRIGALLNTCPHRGMPVCREDRGHARGFTCSYHGWSFRVDGKLMGMPRQKQSYPADLDKSELGLVAVPKVESYCGLIFGCLDPGAVSLESYLGDITFYLDTSFDRRAGGIEVVGGIQKWRVKTNWKLPAENQGGDVAHGPISHQSVFDLSGPEAMKPMNQILEIGRNVALPGGHGLTVRDYPDSMAEDRLPGESATRGVPEVGKYVREVQAEAARRLGPVRERLKIATATVFPTFSLLGSNFTLRVAHPCGPTESEIWSWVFVDRDAPREVKDALRRFYTLTFGPGGIFEQDDGENWEGVTRGASNRYAAGHPFHYGMGLGDEGEHPDLPGLVGSPLSEHTQRAMWRHWRDLMVEDRGGLRADRAR
jgi:phenylpropionate dioxygenase-like ring-hydroxylating dioxygenase large terminal subunit